MKPTQKKWVENDNKHLQSVSFYVWIYRVGLSALILFALLLFTNAYGLHTSAESDSLKLEDKEKLVYLMQVSLANEDLDYAQEYLDRIYKIEGDSAFTALTAARIQLLYGNYDEACILYQKVELLNTDRLITITQEEQDFYKNIKEGKKLSPNKAYKHMTMISYLESQGLKPEEYGYSKDDIVSTEEIASEVSELRSAIIENSGQELLSMSGDKKEQLSLLREALDNVEIIETEYSGYLADTYYNEEIMEKAVKNLYKVYKKTSALFDIEDIDMAYIKGLTLLQEYEDLIRYADEASSQFALAMVANLYTTGKISKNDFNESFRGNSKEEYMAVIDQCTQALERLKDKELDESIIDEFDNIIDDLETMQKNPVLAELDQRMKPETTQIERQSKIYMQKTNVNYELGADNKADASFQAALDTALYSDDISYAAPMRELVDIINDNSDSEEIKNAQNYINEAYQNSLPAKSRTEAVLPESFTQKTSEFISTKKAMINIGYVNTTNFPTVKASVQFGSPIRLSEPKLTVADCYQSIENFTIEKQEYNKLKVYLVCDISGSMDGSEGELQAAIRQFMSNISENEEVALLGFSSSVVFDSGFTNNAADLEQYINQLYPGGGTEIGIATYHSIDQFQPENGTANVIILMTDGNDSSFSTEESFIELKRRCEEKNIILYTIGLGSEISARYLEDIASYGNGRFVYSSDAESLQALYEFIHKQIDNNYLITFEAKNKTDNICELQINNQGDGSVAKKTYRLNYEAEDEVQETGSGIKDVAGSAYANGLDTLTIYKSDSMPSSFQVLGKGFQSVSSLNVSLEGSATYNDLKTSIVDDDHIQVEVGANVQIGTYTVSVSLDGQLYSFDKALNIIKVGVEQTLEFGAYKFKASSISKKGNECILHGNVVMNDYIHFKGDVLLQGDLNSQQVELTDSNGSYITFKKQLPGILKSFYGNTMNLPSLGTLTIYNDEVHLYDLDNYTTEQFTIPALMYSALTFENPYIALYPHMIKISFGA